MNQLKATFCPYCKENGRNKIENNKRCAPYFYAYVNKEINTCEYCNYPTTKMNLTVFELNTILDISSDSSFIEAMDELKSKDIIEFNLKMSQFKSQVNQQKATEESNVPKCPTCGSTNIEKISVGKKALGGAMFGIFSSNIRNTMHCKNCGAKW